MLFCKRKTEAGKEPVVTEQNRRAEDKYRHLEDAAKKLHAENAAKRDDIWATVQAEHKNDIEKYTFDCAKWGSFLLLKAERVANPEHQWGPERKFEDSLNTNLIKNIELKEGRAPDLNGVVRYQSSRAYGRPDEVRGDFFLMNCGRQIFQRDSKDNFGVMYGECREEYVIKTITENFPQYAQDDRIYFNGIGLTIFAPCGLGREIYEKILKTT